MTKRTDTLEQQPQSKPAICGPAEGPAAGVAKQAAGLANHSLLAFAHLLARQVAAEAVGGSPAARSSTETGSMP
jgi:hypothetical protein